MKLLMLLGGVAGIRDRAVLQSDAGKPVGYCLWQASLAAYAGGWLMGWWGRAWQQSLKDAALERATRSDAALATESASKPFKS